ncbi:beta-mannosidase [Jeotgalibaca caeni]|uniref:beta-mannosidase n=1 Tax=Jeotgalibaca caeni TaxID=3028623 RepID=UPI00237DD5B5|nr:glycoside hydrolase family 2 protein [Jeotgalibaca caeni]MDE1549531.1 glycoside hydrolase family 2 TIM barrel-domain containing protein [Jeotgalibaca caeni]
MLTLHPFKKWEFREKLGTEWLEGEVPGNVHSDLLRHGKIPDPFKGKNELELQWIDKTDWEYRTTFDLTVEALNQTHIELVFDGLDTYAEVYLNKNKILKADNMFRTWKVDIKEHVKAEENELYVIFPSPTEIGLKKLDDLGYGLPAANDSSVVGGIEDKQISSFTRKAPYHYGWDWGPRFITMGIWKEVRIESWSDVKIDDVYIRQNKITDEEANITVVTELISDSKRQYSIEVLAEGVQIEQSVSLEEGHNVIEVDAAIQKPKLWWSRGLGDQTFYHFQVNVKDGNKTLEQKNTRTGLRSIQLIREKDTKYEGTTFYFVLNGVPVFAKGANHIPNDSFLTEISYNRYRHEISSAVESNMNMLRVWGGGIYENNEFYDLCDENGILVWQDFMFACGMYPGNNAFLESVEEEVKDNVKRLRNHPSIALWCGNNEIDLAWANYDDERGWGWKQRYTLEQREEIWTAYEAIFHGILPLVLESLHTDVDYWPSSPMTNMTGDSSQHSLPSAIDGDTHYWSVWHNSHPYEEYKNNVSHFVSEYGFQSMPEIKTIQTFAEEKDLFLESEVMLLHQKHPTGNKLLHNYMNMYTRKPKDFPAFVYLSQVNQAQAIQTAIEAHRRRKPYCMGSLYWQMNDCWPVASWSSMDYYGRWKALQYGVKRSFEDVLLSFDENDGIINLYIVSDLVTPLKGTVKIQLFHLNGDELLHDEKEIEVSSNSALNVLSLDKLEVIQNWKENEIVFYAELIVDNKCVTTKEFLLLPMKEYDFQKPTFTITETEKKGVIKFTLETDTFAKSVRLISEKEGIFSDNYFELIPGVKKVIIFYERGFGEEAFVPSHPGELQVLSMVDYIKSNVPIQ